jgi:hypothetical protein
MLRPVTASDHRPNLFIIGAMKSGTSSLHRYLARHPQVFMCSPKEPGYFVEELTWSQGIDWYLRLFEAAGDARIIGESSTHYTKLPVYKGVPERIAAFNPEASLVYLMRDPLRRTESHYWHQVRHHSERRDFATAVAQNRGYLAYSDYAMQLEPYFRVFGRERVYCLTFESMTADPATTVNALCRWLGLDGEVPQEALGERWNVKPEKVRQVRGFGLLNRLAHTSLWSRVAHLVPKRLRRLAGSLASQEVTTDGKANAAILEQLRPQVAEQVQVLGRLLGRDFPEWTTLNGREQ